MQLKTVIVDNGAGSIKAGYDTDKPRSIENSVVKAKTERKRVFIGDQLDECQDLSSLFFLRPFQKGYLVNWDTEHQIWDYTFGPECLNLDPPNCRLIITEPYFNFSSIQDAMDEILFEYYDFNQVFTTTAGQLSGYNYCNTETEDEKKAPKLCCLVVDSGFSFTHIIPYADGWILPESVVRVDMGGKALTNQLKEVVSYGQLQVMEEGYVMNLAKHHSCYVAQDFQHEMRIAGLKGSQNTVLREYVLPDFTTIPTGFLRKPGETFPNIENTDRLQILKLNQERFSVPELLFNPSDVGINQMGLSDAIVYTILEKTPKEMHARLFSNIVLTGGNCLFEGIRERIERDVRCMAPDLYDVNVLLPSTPIDYAWHGGAQLAQAKPASVPNDLFVTKKEYDEHGSVICKTKFNR